MRRLLLLITLLMLLPGKLQAQEPAVWYYAWNSATGQVYAYKPAGESNMLLTVEEVFPVGWRMTDGSVLAVFSADGSLNLYQLAGDSAAVLAASTPDLPLEGLNRLVAQSGNYAVLTSDHLAYTRGFLVDLAAKTVQPLTGETYAMQDTWRISQDGNHLRYLSRADQESLTWNLIDRDLISGVETTFYTFESVFPVIQPDRYGDHWLLVRDDPATRQNVTLLIDSAGTASTLYEETISETFENIQQFRFFDGEIMLFDAPCPADCAIDLQTMSSEPMQTHAISQIISPNVVPLTRLDENRVVVQIENEFWLLNAGGEAELVGMVDTQRISTPTADLLSPNQRYLLSLDPAAEPETAALRLLDLQTGTAIAGDLAPFSVTADYEPGGLLLRDAITNNNAVLYRYGDTTMLELPAETDGFFFAAPDANTLLYAQGRVGVRAAGIYHYDLTSGTFTLILENVFPLLVSD